MQTSEIFSLTSGKGSYFKYGKGPSVILLHGFAETAEIWNKIHPFLSNKNQLIIPKIPDCGNTDSFKEEFSMEAIAQFIYEILEQEKIDSTMLFGHSMGGYAAMAFAEKYPERLNKLSLVHSTAEADTLGKKNIRKTAIEFIRKNGKAPFLKTLIPKLYADIRSCQPDDIKKHMEMASSYSENQLVNCYTAMMHRTDRTYVLEELDLPIQFIGGKQDLSIDYENLIAQAELCKEPTLCIFEGVGHTSMHENPKILLESINGFIDDKFPRSAL